jgi:hypothetical protein
VSEYQEATCCGARYIRYPEGSGATVKGMTEVYGMDPDVTDKVYFALEALDSLLLAHFCAGVDISSKAYQEGVTTALDAIGNHLAGEGV